jgi:nitrite reductase/ring-hydroxylating ferredoxin subunit
VTYHRSVVGGQAQQQATVLEFPAALQAPGTRGAPFEPVAEVGELSAGTMRRVTRGDLDILLANTERGIVAVDDRCPHMSAPLSLGALEGCIVDCPLHSGRFDLCSGETVQFPTTGGLDAEGSHHRPWSPPGREPRPEPTDLKAQARALTRIRRLRYYPVRVIAGRIEIAFPLLPPPVPL